MGLVEPLPWWLDDLMLAEAWHVPPWKLYETWTNREFWKACQHILNSARSEVRRMEEAKAAAKH